MSVCPAQSGELEKIAGASGSGATIAFTIVAGDKQPFTAVQSVYCPLSVGWVLVMVKIWPRCTEPLAAVQV